MRILFVARRFPPSVGGMQRFAYELSTAIEESGARLEKIVWGGSNRWLPLVLPVLILRSMIACARSRSLDVVHVQDASLAPLGWLLGTISGRPWVVVAHGLDVTFANPLYQAVVAPALRRADAVVAISAATGKEVSARGVPEARVHVIPVGVFDSVPQPEPDGGFPRQLPLPDLSDRRVLLTVGRLVRRKGVEWFVSEVMPMLAEDAAIVYLVAGDGPERPSIEAAVRAAALQDRVILLGPVAEATKYALLHGCDLFIMPNIKVDGDMEGFGIVAAEASLARTPVVASDLEGLQDSVTNDCNGILVPPGDADEFASAVRTLLTDDRRRVELGRKAREFAREEFGWEAVAAKYVKLYEALATGSS